MLLAVLFGLATSGMVLAQTSGQSQSTQAQASGQKPNIVFIMGDDIGSMQPGIYHRGLMVGETPNIDRIGNEGAIFQTYYAEQSCTAGRNAFFTGMHPLRTGMIPPQLPGSPSYLQARHAGDRLVPARPRLQHRRVRQEPPGRPHRRASDGARLPRVLGLPVSPRRDAGRELPGHQQDPDPADRRPAVQEHADPRPRRGSRSGGSGDDDVPDAAASGDLVQVLRRHVEEPDLPGSGPADARALQDRGRGDLGQGHRLPRPQRPQEDQQAVLRLVQPGAHARHDRSVGQVPGHGRRARRQGLGHQRGRHEADGRQHRPRDREARGDGPARQHDPLLHDRQRRRDHQLSRRRHHARSRAGSSPPGKAACALRCSCAGRATSSRARS